MRKEQKEDQKILLSQITVVQNNRQNLTIEKWRQALQSAENVRFPLYYSLLDIYAELILDPTIYALIRKRKLGVTGLKIRYLEEDTDTGEINTKYFRGSWLTRLIEYVLESRFYGHSLVEFSFAGGMITAVNLIPRQHVHPEKQTVSLTNVHDKNGLKYTEPPFDLSVLEIGEPGGLGLLNIAAANVIFKRHGTADFADFVELFGSPLRVYEYDPDVIGAKEEADKVAKTTGNASAVTVPKDNVTLEVKNGVETGNTKIHLDFLSMLKEELLVLFLGQTMTTQDGASYAQAFVHSAEQDKITADDRRFVEAFLNEKLLPLLIKHGYPLKEEGGFVFDTSEKIGLAARLEMDLKLAERINIPSEHFYNTYNIRRPEAGEEIAGLETFTPKKQESETPPDEPKTEKKKAFDLSTALAKMYGPAVLSKAAGEELPEIVFDSESFLQGIFNGLSELVSPELFAAYFRVFEAAINESKVIDYSADLAAQLRRNTAVFAAFKVHALQNELTGLLLDEGGSLRTFADFQKEAGKLIGLYNDNWLRAEYNTASRSAYAAAEWIQIQNNKDLFPLLKFETQGDASVRDAHAAFAGIVRPVDDPFWDTHYPPLAWNCRCFVSSRPDGEITPDEAVKDIPKPAPMFAQNVGKTGEIFNESHPYAAVLSSDLLAKIQAEAERLMKDFEK